MKNMKLILDYAPFSIELKLSGPTRGPHLRQILLQIVQAIEKEGVGFNAFRIDPLKTYSYRDFTDAVWRAKHTHTITNTEHAGYVLRQKRLKLGLTGKSFARALGVHSTYLSHVEHGRRPVSENLRKKAESVFRSKVATLARRQSSPPLGKVVHEGQTFFEDLQLAVNNVKELQYFFEHAED
jgi:transcriptional regulator with XRE-family HTH domain